MIELAFEGHRYHDVRRWKLGSTYLNTQIKGWSVLEQDPEYFYNARVSSRENSCQEIIYGLLRQILSTEIRNLFRILNGNF